MKRQGLGMMRLSGATDMPTNFRICLVMLCLLAAAASAAAGAEVTSMRTEYSRTFLQADGRYTTEIYTTPISVRDPSGGWVPVDVDSSHNCYPQGLPDWTGNVKRQNNSYTRISGDLYFRGGQSSSQDRRQAWAKFDLSPIPNGAILTTAYLWYYCYSAGQMPTTVVRLVASDPVVTEAATLWSNITTGTLVAPSYGHGTGWQSRELNSVGVAAVQSRLTTDWIALGLHEAEPNNNIWGLNEWGIVSMLRRLEKVTGLPCNPHTFRRTFACLLRKAGIDTMTIKDLGRWESLEMVQRYTRSVNFQDSLKFYKAPLS